MNKKLICFIAAAVYAALSITIAFALSANEAFDVVANYAITSFEKLGERPAPASTGRLYEVRSPAETEAFLYGERVQLAFDLAAFATAGFDPDKFESEITEEDGWLKIVSEMVEGVDTSNADALSVFENVIRNGRSHLEYHMEHDLFELHLGGGHTFRWAKDPQTNTRGMTFVLNPEPFIEAGLDPDQLEGWTQADVTMMHGPQRGQTVPRLLRNYSFAAE